MAAPELIDAFALALDNLHVLTGMSRVDAVSRDAAIKRFELAYELGWKAAQAVLRDLGLDCRSPKACLREAYRQGWIDDQPLWLRMADDRNQTVHTYNEATAAAIYVRLPEYVPLLSTLLDAIRNAAA